MKKETTAFLKQLLIPLLIVVFSALYWFSIRDAPSVSRRVPLVVIAVIAVFLVMTLVKIRLEVREQSSATDEGADAPEAGFVTWMTTHRAQLLLIGLSIGYYFVFEFLGFDLSNLLFMLAVLPSLGYAHTHSARSRVIRTGVVALSTVVVLHVLALLMDFNVPLGLLDFD